MNNDLRERDLYAGLIKGDLDLPVHDPRSPEQIFLINGCTDLERDSVVTKLINAKILRCCKEYIRILLEDLWEEVVEDLLNLLDIFLICNRYQCSSDTSLL